MGTYAYQATGEVFIETGTYRGDSLAAAAVQFPLCHSIEWDYDLYRAALVRFEDQPGVKLWHGSSPQLLRPLCDPRQVTVFWLDAHFMADRDGMAMHDPAYGQCPLLAELAVIAAVPWQSAVTVLIDDAHLFGEAFWTDPADADGTVAVGEHRTLRQGLKRAEWPTEAQLRSILPEWSCEPVEGSVLRLERFW